MCQEVKVHAAALQQAAAAAHAPLEAKQLLAIIKVLGSLGAVLIKGSHPAAIQLAAVQALHRCAVLSGLDCFLPQAAPTLC